MPGRPDFNLEFARTVEGPDSGEKRIAAGAEPATSSPETSAAFLRKESERLGRLLKSAGVASTQ